MGWAILLIAFAGMTAAASGRRLGSHSDDFNLTHAQQATRRQPRTLRSAAAFRAERFRSALRFRKRRADRGRLRAPAMLPVPYALDALNFLSADVRNLFGPFINVFLVTGQHWTRPTSGW
jgi:hypothetical protein